MGITRDRHSAAAALSLHDLSIGQRTEFNVVIEARDIDRFAEISGDKNPLHVDECFARERGYAGRVMHGAHLVALVSRLVGMDLPGRNALLLTVNFSFAAPVVAGTPLHVVGEVEQVSETVRSAVVKVRMTDRITGATVARGRATVGFTDHRPEHPGYA